LHAVVTLYRRTAPYCVAPPRTMPDGSHTLSTLPTATTVPVLTRVVSLTCLRRSQGARIPDYGNVHGHRGYQGYHRHQHISYACIIASRHWQCPSTLMPFSRPVDTRHSDSLHRAPHIALRSRGAHVALRTYTSHTLSLCVSRRPRGAITSGYQGEQPCRTVEASVPKRCPAA
jgi:hypothetical protein